MRLIVRLLGLILVLAAARRSGDSQRMLENEYV
jgi:hypothetical protein